jgi:hypothetical protein
VLRAAVICDGGGGNRREGVRGKREGAGAGGADFLGTCDLALGTSAKRCGGAGRGAPVIRNGGLVILGGLGDALRRAQGSLREEDGGRCGGAAVICDGGVVIGNRGER